MHFSATLLLAAASLLPAAEAAGATGPFTRSEKRGLVFAGHKTKHPPECVEADLMLCGVKNGAAQEFTI